MTRPSAEALHFFLSALGDAVCDHCDESWPCHLNAWGSPGAESNCARCGVGPVRWHPPAQTSTGT